MVVTEYYPVPARPDLPGNQRAVAQLCVDAGEEEAITVLCCPVYRRREAWRRLVPLMRESTAWPSHRYQDEAGRTVLVCEHPSVLPRTTELYPLFARKMAATVQGYMREKGILAFDGMAVHFPSRYAELVMKIPARRRVAVLHAFDVKRRGRLRRLDRKLDGFEETVCRAPWIAERLAKRGRTQLGLCLSGVAAEAFVQPDARRAWKEDGKLAVMYAGRLEQNKQVDVLLEAVARLGSGAQVQLTVVGDGKQREQLEQQSRELGIAKWVTFAGWRKREAVLRVMRMADVLVLPSRSETLGMVCLEAMAAGTLVVAGRGQGVDGVVEHGKNGLLVNTRRRKKRVAAELAGALEQLMRMERKSAYAMQEAARKAVSALEEHRISRAYLNLMLGEKEQKEPELWEAARK